LKNSRAALIIAFSALTLVACSGRGAVDRPGLNLPGPPSYLQPVKVPYGTATTDARELAIQRRHAIEDANSRISKGRAAWIRMKKDAARKGK
jgi:hypothetical protein